MKITNDNLESFDGAGKPRALYQDERPSNLLDLSISYLEGEYDLPPEGKEGIEHHKRFCLKFNVVLLVTFHLLGESEIIDCNKCKKGNTKKPPFVVLTPTGKTFIEFKENPIIPIIVNCCPSNQ